MKTKHISNWNALALVIIVMSVTACSDEWLMPNRLSAYTPENSLVDADGMYAALTTCDRLIRHEYYATSYAHFTEQYFSDVAVDGTTDNSAVQQNLNLLITPTNVLDDLYSGRIDWFWDQGFMGVKYANSVITRIDDIKYRNDEERNAVLAAAYFHRSYRYYRLTHQFGDVPFIGEEYSAPKLDFYSTKREVILKYIKQDMDFAASWATLNPDKGKVTRGACGHLLTKINLSLGLFDEAIASATAVIDGGQHRLMTERFGADASKTDKNVLWDLHLSANKSIPANRECLLNCISREEAVDGSDRMQIMYMTGPFWSAAGGNAIKTPNGKIGMSMARDIEYEYSVIYGRGVAKVRGVPYSTQMIWQLDDTDLRHQRSWYDEDGTFHQGNWVEMEDLLYNNPALNDPNSSDYDPEWYGKPLRLYDDNGTILTLDTIRNWFAWPFYKLYIPDPTTAATAAWTGGRGDWYVYRLAETYLLRAEAYFWKGELQRAADDINVVRRRAQAREITASEVNMRMILDERARELYFEEPRKTELTRISFIYATTGKPADDGTVYSLSNFSEKNFWYDHIMSVNYFYNLGVKTVHNDEFTISAYHVLWPVPQPSINSNINGVINQNKGYSGYEKNVPPLESIEQ